MKQVVSYRRVSTTKQERSGLGLEGQSAAIGKFSEQEGLQVMADFQDVASGAAPLDGRPGLTAALAMASRLKCPVVVSKLDRLSRDVAFIAALMSRGVPFLVADLGMDTDPFVLHLYAALSEKERKMIGVRTREALAAKKREGVLLGNRSNLAVAQSLGRETTFANAREFAGRAMALIGPLQEGGSSLNEIARSLNASNVPTARGGSWTAKAVSRILKIQRDASQAWGSW